VANRIHAIEISPENTIFLTFKETDEDLSNTLEQRGYVGREEYDKVLVTRVVWIKKEPTYKEVLEELEWVIATVMTMCARSSDESDS